LASPKIESFDPISQTAHYNFFKSGRQARKECPESGEEAKDGSLTYK